MFMCFFCYISNSFVTHIIRHKLSGMEKIASFPAFQLFAAFLFDVFVN